ncbi:MAG TPA: sigma-70 family RNA polymerase sigma factor [Planctomycetota bacterium]|nr:sigma-70 family RNA polymerase sigma factor [Planctomycetota bacterium]
MPKPIADQLQDHARALRALARDLVGEQHADDLLQDAAVQAIVAPPAMPGPVGGWFATVLRHLAAKHRRGERRRRQRESAAARSEPIVAADIEAAARDQFRRLNDAVLALPQPYQGALLRRYLHEQSPAEIAAATGAPLATVKSQLRRGLALLRERFEGDDSDWRAGLAAAFALREAPATAAAAGTVTTGVLIMANAGKLMGLAAAIGLAVTGVWCLRGEEPVATGATAELTQPSPLAAAVAVAPTRTNQPSAPPQRTLVAEPRPAQATVRGRCVDASGAPLAGCRVIWNGMPNNSDEFEQWVRRHYDPQWQNPAAVQTSADGRFEFHFVPHEPLRFVLSVQHEGRVAMRASWQSRLYGEGIDPGAVIELGDLALLPGVQARGRVADDTGAPVAGASVTLSRARRNEGPQANAIEADAVCTDANGLFVAAMLAPGSYLVSIEPIEGYAGGLPQRHELLEPAPWLELALQRAKLPPSVQGIVVDDLGNPVAHASIQAAAAHRGAWSRTDGTFTLLAAPDDATVPTQLLVDKEGYDLTVVKGPFAWGTRDLRAVLRRGVDVALHVVDAQGAPVEEYAAWIWIDDDGTRPRVVLEGDQHARTFGHHDGGAALLHGLRRARQCLFVEPRDESLIATEVRRIEITDPSPVHLTVVLPMAAQRRVRVLDGDDAPVAGTTVELVEQAQGGLDAATAVWPIETMLRTFGPTDKALLRQRVETDTHGEATVRGPRQGRLAIRVPGPGNLPAFVDDVHLDDPSPLVVHVRRGGTLQIELRPAGVVAALRSYAGLGELQVPAWEPKLQLVRRDPAGPEAAEELHEVALRGSTTLSGLPSGRWQLRLAACTRSSPLFAHHWRLELGEHELRDGATTAVVLDLPQLLPARLHGTVLHNGTAMASAQLTLRGVFDASETDHAVRRAPYCLSVTTDEAGSFAVTVRPGRYTVVATDPFRVAADEVIQIGPGDQATPTFTLRSGRLRVRYRDTEGRPMPQVDAVLLDTGHGDEAFSLACSDVQGVSNTTVAARTFALFAQRCHAGDSAPDRLPLGEVTVLMGGTTIVERSLPPSWTAHEEKR